MSTVLSGSPISILSTLGQDRDFNSLLLLAAHQSQRYTGSLGYENRSISLSSVMDQLKKDVLQQYGSMFTEDTGAYSPKDHMHSQYSKTEVENYGQGWNVMHIRDGDSVYQVQDLVYEQEQWWTTYIGQLKFVAGAWDDEIDIESDGFDGWVYADGKKYVTDEFSAAKEYLVSDSSSFTVPNLDSFFKCSPAALDVSYGYPEVTPYNTEVPPHSHNIAVQLTGTAQVELSTWITSSTGNGGYSHAGGTNVKGCKFVKKWQKVGTVALSAGNVTIAGISTADSDSGLETETYPTHNVVRAMIYIGGRDE